MSIVDPSRAHCPRCRGTNPDCGSCIPPDWHPPAILPLPGAEVSRFVVGLAELLAPEPGPPDVPISIRHPTGSDPRDDPMDDPIDDPEEEDDDQDAEADGQGKSDDDGWQEDLDFDPDNENDPDELGEPIEAGEFRVMTGWATELYRRMRSPAVVVGVDSLRRVDIRGILANGEDNPMQLALRLAEAAVCVAEDAPPHAVDGAALAALARSVDDMHRRLAWAAAAWQPRPVNP